MMNHCVRHFCNAGWFAIIFLGVSCQEDEFDKTAVIRFEVTNAVYTEDMLNVKINVFLDRERDVNVIVKGTWTAKNSTSLNGGDFEISEDISIPAFKRSSFFPLSIINDRQIDEDDEITLKLIQPTGNNIVLSSNPAESYFSFVIKNNDLVPENKLQADLTWHRKDLHSNINDVDFELYLQSDVVIENGQITDVGKTVTSSEHPLGFETLWLDDTSEDKDYFFVVYYRQTYYGEIVTYDLTLNGLGFSDKSMGGVLKDTDLGATFIGPFRKIGKNVVKGRRGDQPFDRYFVTKSAVEGRIPN